jgi:hypothetical protein
MNDHTDPFTERLENCPPHLRGRLMRQQSKLMASQYPTRRFAFLDRLLCGIGEG